MMRALAGLFGTVCGAIIIAVTARYGFRTADNELDGYIWAFMFGLIALGGLCGHAVAVRVWRESRLAAVLIGLVSMAALTINLSNSLGAMADRGNEKQAARLNVAEIAREARRELRRTQDEREAMRFMPTNAAAVEAAKSAGNAATKSREAECGIRGKFCRERENNEREALDALQRAIAGKAASDQANALDANIARLKQRIEGVGPVLETNSQGFALARILNLPESSADWLLTWQNFGMAIVAELLIVLSLVAFELLGKPKPIAAAPEPVALEPIAEPVSPPKVFPVPAKPRLITSRPVPAGNVALILADLMEPCAGRVEFAEAYAGYVGACRSQNKRPVSPDDFSTALRRICREMRIRIESKGGYVFLVGVAMNKRLDVTYRTIG